MTTMISYKVLMTLTVIFIISSKAGNVEEVKNCKTILSELGFSNHFGFINFCAVRQFKDIFYYRIYLEGKGIAFVNFTPGSREMTVKEEILTKFFEDNFIINSINNLCRPIDFCREHNNDKRGFKGCLSHLLRSRAKCEKEITKKCERITTIIPTIENGVGSISQTYSKENIYGNVIISFNLNSNNYTESTKITIDENVQLWPGSKQGYFNKLLDEIKSQNKSEEYWTTTKWCMQYYKLEPIKDSTSGTNPPLLEEMKTS